MFTDSKLTLAADDFNTSSVRLVGTTERQEGLSVHVTLQSAHIWPTKSD